MNEKTIVVKQGSFGSFLRGVVIGAAVALLFAPRSGRETRDMLNQRGNELKDKATDVASTARDRAMDMRDRAQSMIDDARNKVDDTMKNVTQKNANMGTDVSKQELEREVTILEDINNPDYKV